MNFIASAKNWEFYKEFEIIIIHAEKRGNKNIIW